MTPIPPHNEDTAARDKEGIQGEVSAGFHCKGWKNISKVATDGDLTKPSEASTPLSETGDSL